MSLLESGIGNSIRASRPFHQRTRERGLVINGHPDPRPERFCAALCRAWVAGAAAAGQEADTISLGEIFPAEGQSGTDQLAKALDALRNRARLMVVFPLWLDNPPEIVTRFFEHVARDCDPGLRNCHAHVLVTMSLPAFAHRSIARGSAGADRLQNAISLVGVEIDALNFVGSVDSLSLTQREEWLHRLRRLGTGR
ncbi:MAG TPA: NAD(P)H-dependent oxidoreductase [Rhizomicrobium sp.]|nr:NAD(P)H-dependent oxidoreductase [Rhizomicrobium sp.]